MPATISNPRDLYLTLLGEALFVERMLSFEIIPQMLGKITSPALSGLMSEHLEQTRQHARNAEDAFAAAGAHSSSNLCRALVALREQHAQLSQAAVTPALADAAHAHAALAVELYETASYEGLLALAPVVAPGATEALKENLAQDQDAARRLQELLAGLAQDSSQPAKALG